MKANNELVLEGVSYLFIISKFRRNLSLYRPRVHCGQHSTSLKKWDATNNQLTLQYRGLILECVKLVGVRQRQVAVGAVKAETISAPIPCISGTLLGILSIPSKLLTKRWSSFKGQGQAILFHCLLLSCRLPLEYNKLLKWLCYISSWYSFLWLGDFLFKGVVLR